ncbi:MAG TPA: AtpZ/AtpI family protein, partial [Methyloceanibacter sp.]
MAEREPPNPLRDLDERLKRLRAEESGGKRAAAEAEERGRGLGYALRIGVELVAALAVGVGIGLVLDRWLGTTPWLLIVFFVLGAAAGL